jgi:hypothetical protein
MDFGTKTTRAKTKQPAAASYVEEGQTVQTIQLQTTLQRLFGEKNSRDSKIL